MRVEVVRTRLGTVRGGGTGVVVVVVDDAGNATFDLSVPSQMWDGCVSDEERRCKPDPVVEVAATYRLEFRRVGRSVTGSSDRVVGRAKIKIAPAVIGVGYTTTLSTRCDALTTKVDGVQWMATNHGGFAPRTPRGYVDGVFTIASDTRARFVVNANEVIGSGEVVELVPGPRPNCGVHA